MERILLIEIIFCLAEAYFYVNIERYFTILQCNLSPHPVLIVPDKKSPAEQELIPHGAGQLDPVPVLNLIGLLSLY